MTKLIVLVVVIVVMAFGTAQATQNKSTAQVNINNNAPECPDVKLHRERPDGQRLSYLMLVDDPLYLSDHYCFGFWQMKAQTNEIDLPTKYSFRQTSNLFKRYDETYKTLRNDSQKIAFTHLYFKALTQQTIVLPDNGHAKEMSYALPCLKEGNVVLFSHPIAKLKNDYDLLHDGLIALAAKPDIDKDWPKLVKLVDKVLTNLDSRTAQTVEDFY